jgi:E1A/CREB-binding protein
VKTLFRHGVECPKKAAGGCHCCRRVCTLLHVHAKSCKLANCPVPQCSELKDYRRRLQMQMEDRRRVNAMAMYRGQTQPDED